MISLERKHLNAFLVSLGVLCFVWLPTILSSRPYIDDVGRTIRGYYEWSPNGRPIAQIIFGALNVGKHLIDVYPAYQIIALAVMALCCVLMLIILNIEISIKNALLSSVAFITPFYMENISYRFDALSMALSCLFCMVSLIASRKFSLWMILGIAMGVIFLSTYQTFLSVYIILVAASILNVESIKDAFRKVAPPAVAMIAFYAIYSKFVAPAFLEGDYNKVHSEISLSPETMIYNLKTFLKMQIDFYGGLHGYAFTLLLVLALAFAVYQILSSSHKVTIAWKAPLILFMLVSSLAIFLPLKSPVFNPRVFVGFGFAMAAILMIAQRPMLKMVNLATSSCYILAMFILSCAYGNASSYYAEYEKLVAYDITTKVNALPQKDVVFYGQVEPTVKTRQISKAYPIVDYMVRPYIKDDIWWGKLMLEDYGMTKRSITDKKEKEALHHSLCAKKMTGKGVYELDGHIAIILSDQKC